MIKKLGLHMSLTGGYKKQLKNAAMAGAETIQIFSGNPTSWRPPKLDKDMAFRFIMEQKNNEISPLIFHTPYLINMASPKTEIHEKSVDLLRACLKRAELFGAPYVITHVGSHLGEGKDKGIYKICKGLDILQIDWPKNVMLLLENTAGSGNSIGSSFKEIKQILDSFSGSLKNLGFCFDSAHAFGAGYDLSTRDGVSETMKELEECIDLRLLKVIHANDTIVERGSKKDRHEDISKGNIGEEGFSCLLNRDELVNVEAVIIETPKRTDNSDKENLNRLKKIMHR